MERQYRRAIEVFTNAVQLKKSIIKLKSSFNTFETGGDQFPEPEIRFKLAQCLEATQQISEAATVLQVVSIKNRSPKINMLLAKLLTHDRCDRNAIGPLKAVLKECPLNLAAIKYLAAFGLKATEINAIISDSKYCETII